MPNIRDLGELTGEVILFGGVYSNLQALDALIEIVSARGSQVFHLNGYYPAQRGSTPASSGWRRMMADLRPAMPFCPRTECASTR
ncbi:hypothetical protein [Litoreibacter halocynthiae]|uniref:hypothetical protein n=1 Tax=Litoreibacter halocynthiae TaxID=1242689 RepID=UPI0010634302|nr:hypothetical protein [Litoreibacter halocynthiae]